MPSWNITKSLKAARNNALAGVQPPTPPDFSDIGTPPTIDVGGVTTDFVFGILGVVPQRVDISQAVLEETIERWPARPREAGFPLKYQYLDATGLDAEFITDVGLTASVSEPDTWVGYYPTMVSNTQLYTNAADKPDGWEDDLVVGGYTVFGTTQSLDGTAYTVGTRIYGREANNPVSVRWSGIVVLREDYDSMEVAIDSVGGALSAIDPTAQQWFISNDFDLLDNLF
jgi:hypothetical protein